jgi:hypothetical protein
MQSCAKTACKHVFLSSKPSGGRLRLQSSLLQLPKSKLQAVLQLLRCSSLKDGPAHHSNIFKVVVIQCVAYEINRKT